MDDNQTQSESQNDETYSGGTNRSWIQRTFGPMKAGSFRGSVFILISSMIGIGFLTLPAIGKSVGLYPLIFLVLQSAMLSLLANIMLGRGFYKYKEKTYDALVCRIVGPNWGLASRLCLYIYLLASTAAYFMINATFFFSLLLQYDVVQEKHQTMVQTVFIIGVAVLAFLISLPKKLTVLSYFTWISTALILFISVVIVCQYKSFHDYNEDHDVSYLYFDINIYFFSCYCLSLFSTINQFAVLTVLNGYTRPTLRRIKKLVVSSCIFPLCIYLAVSILGYLSFGSLTEGLVIDRHHIPNQTDYMMTIGKSGLCVCLLVGVIIRVKSNKDFMTQVMLNVIPQLNIHKVKKESNSEIKQKINVEIQLQTNPSDSNSPKKQKPKSIKTQYKKVTSQDQTNTSQDDNEVITDYETNQENTEDSINQSVIAPEASNKVKFFNHFFVCAFPAFLACFLTKQVIGYISSAAGTLAPTFIVIFPVMVTLRLHSSGEMPLRPAVRIAVIVYGAFYTIFSYVAVIIGLFYSAGGGA